MTTPWQHFQKHSELSLSQAEQLQNIVLSYGEAYDSYLNSESNREYFFTRDFPGVISFCRVGVDIEMLGGLCAPQEFKAALLDLFLQFMAQNGLALSCFNVPEADIGLFRAKGFRISKLGEELFLNLNEKHWQGKFFLKLRHKVNQCARRGIQVVEISDSDYELYRSELAQITHDQLAEKSQKEALQFFVGACPPRTMEHRRIFVAKSATRIESFVVLVPYKNGRAFGLDSFRMRPDAIRNAMLFLIKGVTDALKAEHLSEFSLGAAPGAQCSVPLAGDKAAIRWLLHVTFHYLNFIYNLKGIYHFKLQFHPKARNLYLACYPDQFTWNGIYAFFKTFGMFNIQFAAMIKNLFAPAVQFSQKVQVYLQKALSYE